MEDKSRNILAKILIKHNESEQNIRFSYETRPGRDQDIAKVDSIKDIYYKCIKSTFNRKLG